MRYLDDEAGHIYFRDEMYLCQTCNQTITETVQGFEAHAFDKLASWHDTGTKFHYSNYRCRLCNNFKTVVFEWKGPPCEDYIE